MLQNFTYGSKNQQHFSTNISANRQARSASRQGEISLSSKHQAVTTPVSPLAKKSASRSVSFILPSASVVRILAATALKYLAKLSFASQSNSLRKNFRCPSMLANSLVNASVTLPLSKLSANGTNNSPKKM